MLKQLKIGDAIEVVWREANSSNEWAKWSGEVTHVGNEVWAIFTQKPGFYLEIPQRDMEYATIRSVPKPRMKPAPQRQPAPAPLPEPKVAAPKPSSTKPKTGDAIEVKIVHAIERMTVMQDRMVTLLDQKFAPDDSSQSSEEEEFDLFLPQTWQPFVEGGLLAHQQLKLMLEHEFGVGRKAPTAKKDALNRVMQWVNLASTTESWKGDAELLEMGTSLLQALREEVAKEDRLDVGRIRTALDKQQRKDRGDAFGEALLAEQQRCEKKPAPSGKRSTHRGAFKCHYCSEQGHTAWKCHKRIAAGAPWPPQGKNGPGGRATL